MIDYSWAIAFGIIGFMLGTLYSSIRLQQMIKKGQIVVLRVVPK
jgi:hypothetical protein